MNGALIASSKVTGGFLHSPVIALPARSRCKRRDRGGWRGQANQISARSLTPTKQSLWATAAAALGLSAFAYYHTRPPPADHRQQAAAVLDALDAEARRSTARYWSGAADAAE